MKNIKNPKDVFYISVIALAFIVAIILVVRVRSDIVGKQSVDFKTPSLAP